MEIQKKKQIVRLIDELKNKKLYIELFKIILAQKINYTQNSNGVFINLNGIPDEKLEIIYNFLYKHII
jgi:hypothetical protein